MVASERSSQREASLRDCPILHAVTIPDTIRCRPRICHHIRLVMKALRGFPQVGRFTQRMYVYAA